MVGGGLVTAAPTVWILVHDLGRSGVPVVLARLLASTPAARGSVHVVAIRGGPLEAGVRAVAASVTTLEPERGRSRSDALAVGLDELGLPGGRAVRGAVWRRRLRSLPTPDVVVVHGAGAWPLLDAVPAAAPLVVHLHELGTGLDRSVPTRDQEHLLTRAARVLAVSRPVADLAVARGAPSARVELLAGVVRVDDALGPTFDGGDRDGGGGGADAGCSVMGAGQVGWRKGTDRLAAVAYELERVGRPGQVGWVGGCPGGADTTFVGAPDPVRWWPSCPDPWAVMGAAEVVVVPSREDPLPLVALEAGLRRKAVVAMPTGGLPELLADGRGRVVSRHDVVEFAREVVGLLGAPDDAAAAGDALFAHVVAHHDAETVAPRWWDLVTSPI